jgi:hypothetical protein
MRRSSRRQTWSPEGATAIRKRRRRRTHKNVERQRLRFSLLVVTFVVAWLWFVMTVVSWISQDKSPVNTHNNGGAEHSSLRGNGHNKKTKALTMTKYSTRTRRIANNKSCHKPMIPLHFLMTLFMYPRHFNATVSMLHRATYHSLPMTWTSPW